MMSNPPLVSVICLCYNHEKYVKEAIQSVLDQNYQAVQLIVLDDGSTDQSAATIRSIISHHPSIQFLVNEINQGYTKSLNKALSYASGEFIVDLAADDILLPSRIDEGVNALLQAGTKYGVNFSDAELISEQGISIGFHSDKYPHHSIPEGDVYAPIISRYFICSPTMLFRKKVIEQLGGYDESLAFEDFDFLVRASREFYFCYSPKALVKRRLVPFSMSQKQFSRGNAQRLSTLRVCEKIEKLNRTAEEKNALKKRVRYEILLSLRMFDFNLALAFLQFYFRLSSPKTMLV